MCVELGNRTGIKLDQYGFCQTHEFNPLETSGVGFFAAGPFREPKTPRTRLLKPAARQPRLQFNCARRNSLTSRIEYPLERPVAVSFRVWECSSVTALQYCWFP